MIKISSEQILRWLDVNLPDYKLKSKKTQVQLCNPFDSDTGWHFWISLKHIENKHGKVGYWVHDFRPDKQQYGMSFIKFVQTYKNISYRQALREICGSDVRIVEEKDEEKDEKPDPEIKQIELPRCKSFSVQDDSLARKIAKAYLSGRRISESVAVKYSLGYTPTSIVFPYYEFGELAYWQTRDITSKTFNFPSEGDTGLKKTDFLFGFDHVEPGSDIAVMESIIDSISVGDFAVATGGAMVSEVQAKKIRILHPKRIILCPDNDDAGREALRQDFDMLRSFFGSECLYVCIPKTVKDWNDMDRVNGVGSAREYIKSNTSRLDLKTLINISLHKNS